MLDVTLLHISHLSIYQKPSYNFVCSCYFVLEQLCPTHSPAEGFVRPIYIVVVVKVSYILTTCPFFDNLEFDISVASGP